MLSIVLLSTVCFAASKHHYATHQEFFDPARLERKSAKQDIRRANLDMLRARAAESQAAVLVAEEELQRKEAKLQRLKELFAQYNDYQEKVKQILREIGLENVSEVKEAVKEVQVAQADVKKAENNSPSAVGEVPSVTGEVLPPVINEPTPLPVTEVISQEPANNSTPATIEAPVAPTGTDIPGMSLEPTNDSMSNVVLAPTGTSIPPIKLPSFPETSSAGMSPRESTNDSTSAVVLPGTEPTVDNNAIKAEENQVKPASSIS